METAIRQAPRGAQRWIFLWGSMSVVAMLGASLWRLAPLALAPLQDGSAGPLVLALYAVWALFMAYSEGYRGFHLRFSPRVVARAYHLAQSPTPLHVLLALPYCMSLFHTTKRQKIISWCLLLGIVGVVMLVRQLPQPWRGVVDGGVIIGLGLGSLSILFYVFGALRGRIPADAALPEEAAELD